MGRVRPTWGCLRPTLNRCWHAADHILAAFRQAKLRPLLAEFVQYAHRPKAQPTVGPTFAKAGPSSAICSHAHPSFGRPRPKSPASWSRAKAALIRAAQLLRHRPDSNGCGPEVDQHCFAFAQTRAISGTSRSASPEFRPWWAPSEASAAFSLHAHSCARHDPMQDLDTATLSSPTSRSAGGAQSLATRGTDCGNMCEAVRGLRF